MLLHVPAALPLAVIAFMADLLPVVGTIAMTVPAVLLALTVGPVKALLVLAGYMLYHFVESYFIVPRVYGKQMRLSTLTVLLVHALFGAFFAGLMMPREAGVERVFARRIEPATITLLLPLFFAFTGLADVGSAHRQRSLVA